MSEEENINYDEAIAYLCFWRSMFQSTHNNNDWNEKHEKVFQDVIKIINHERSIS